MDSKDMELICRTCLKVIHEKELFINAESQTKRGKVGDILETCVSELNLDFNDDVVLCCNCFTMLKISYEFKLKCLFTEDKIFAYLHKHNLSIFDKINLSDVLRHHKDHTSKTQELNTDCNNVNKEKQSLGQNHAPNTREIFDVNQSTNQPLKDINARACKESKNVVSLQNNSLPVMELCTQGRHLNTADNADTNRYYKNVVMFDQSGKSDEVDIMNNDHPLNLIHENVSAGNSRIEISRSNNNNIPKTDWGMNLENCRLNTHQEENLDSFFESSLLSSNPGDIFNILANCL